MNGEVSTGRSPEQEERDAFEVWKAGVVARWPLPENGRYSAVAERAADIFDCSIWQIYPFAAESDDLATRRYFLQIDDDEFQEQSKKLKRAMDELRPDVSKEIRRLNRRIRSAKY